MLSMTGCEKSENKEAPKASAKTEAPVSESADKKVAEETTGPRKTLAEAVTPTPEPKVEEQPGPEVAPAGKVAALLPDGTSIAQEEVFKRVEKLPQRVRDSMPFTQLYNLVLFVILQEHVAYQAAVNEHLEDKEDVAARLKTMYSDLLQQLYLDEVSEKLITEEAIKKQYDSLTKGFKSEPEVGLRHILVKTPEAARKVIALLKSGQSFDFVQKNNSEDKDVEKNQGYLGFFRKGQLPKEQADEIMATEVGQYVKTPIQVPGTGYSVLYVKEKRDSKPASIEKVKSSLRSLVLKRLAMEHIQSLFKKYGVKIFDPEGKVIPIKTIDERLEEVRQRRAQKDKQPTKEEKRKEASLDSLKNEFVVVSLDSGEKVTFEQILAFIKEKPGMFKNLSVYETYTTAAEECANRIVLRMAVEEAQMAKRTQAIEKWNQTKRTYLYREYLRRAAEKLLTESELRQRYDKLVAKIDPNEVEVSLRAIPVASMEDGNKALAALKSGKPFEEVLNTYCTEDEFKKRKGEMGYIRKKQLSRLSTELVEAVNTAPKGTLLPKPLLVQGRVLVIKVNDKKPITIPKYAEVRGYLRKNFIPDMMIQATINLIGDVKAYGFDGNLLNLSREEIEKTLGNSSQIARN